MTLNNKNGYVILTAVIVLSAGLLLISSVIAFSHSFGDSQANDYLNKIQSYFLAYSCLDIAKYRLDDDLDYEGNEVISLTPDQSCRILPIIYEGINTVIETRASTSESVTHLLLKMDPVFNILDFKQL